MSAVKKYLGKGEESAGKVFVTSGLGGMSGAQAKAAVIAGCVGVIAEVSEAALVKRHEQKWLDVWSPDLGQIIEWIRQYKREKKVSEKMGQRKKMDEGRIGHLKCEIN
jgi:urocanate hydratase